jgi:energy-converting hydrogenase Eha subunit F
MTVRLPRLVRAVQAVFLVNSLASITIPTLGLTIPEMRVEKRRLTPAPLPRVDAQPGSPWAPAGAGAAESAHGALRIAGAASESVQMEARTIFEVANGN